MIRTIITIDSNACNGCGLCVDACHEGAIGLENGKAVLLRDDYCDGLGNCLPVCPTGAISFEQREALPFDEKAVEANMKKQQGKGGCPGSMAGTLPRPTAAAPGASAGTLFAAHNAPSFGEECQPGEKGVVSQLRQWPVQIKLVPPKADFFDNAHLLVAADCSAFARADFHATFMEGKVTIIGCPKLDDVDYSEKLQAIITQNAVRSVTVVRMSVPCCTGIASAAQKAVAQSGKDIPLSVITLLPDGRIAL